MLWLATGSNLFSYRGWNVTQDKYEAALAKWHSLPIEEYEVTLTLAGSGKWKIKVQVERTSAGRVEKITSLESLDADAANLKKHWDVEYFEESWTVDAMFRNVNLALQRPDRINPIRSDTYLEINFDPAMGYPRTCTMYDTRDTTDLVLVDLKVLK
jgi:hypothetical protein